jgi:hypothetical protein
VRLSEDVFLPRILGSVIAILLSLSLFIALTAKNGTPIGIYDDGIGDHWPAGHRTLTIVDRSDDPGWHDAIAAAVATWTAGGSALQFVLTTGTGPCRQRRDDIEYCQASSEAIARKGSEGEQGLFDPFVGASHDYHSAILLVCSDCGIDQVRMTVIATHELGHALGLAHNPDPGSVMYYLGGSPQPDARDYQILRSLEGSAPAARG